MKPAQWMVCVSALTFVCMGGLAESQVVASAEGLTGTQVLPPLSSAKPGHVNLAGVDRAPVQTSLVPACGQVELKAEYKAKPPVTVAWHFDNGLQMSGDPLVFDANVLPLGDTDVIAVVSNAQGYGAWTQRLRKEDASFSGTVQCSTIGTRQIQCSVPVQAASEIKFNWGDGSNTGWIAPCSTVQHTYSNFGTYVVKAKARACPGDVVEQTLSVDVETQGMNITQFQAVGCDQAGTCSYPAAKPIPFLSSFNGVGTWDIDWDGDGDIDETLTHPPESHTYIFPGQYQPIVYLRQGFSSFVSYTHILQITVGGSLPGVGLVASGFEPGSAATFSRTQ